MTEQSCRPDRRALCATTLPAVRVTHEATTCFGVCSVNSARQCEVHADPPGHFSSQGLPHLPAPLPQHAQRGGGQHEGPQSCSWQCLQGCAWRVPALGQAQGQQPLHLDAVLCPLLVQAHERQAAVLQSVDQSVDPETLLGGIKVHYM